MLERIERYLSDMTQIPALSGYEQPMAAYMKAEFTRLGFETAIDVLGNCIAKVPGTQPDAPVVMVFSHMDSLGFLVRHIEPDGFLRIERLGGIPEKVLPAIQVQVLRDNGGFTEGVFGVKRHHLTPPEEKYKVEPYKNLYIDIGLSSREEVLDLGIHVGSPVVYSPKFVKLQGNRAIATSVDNRAGCATILELANRLATERPDSTTYLVGTVQEEYNLRGGMMAARTVKPDIAVAIDGGGGYDTPDLKGMGDVAVGKGPVMSMYNFHGRGTLNGTIPHPAMVRLFEQAARDKGIHFQRNAFVGGLTDASYVQLEGTGVMCIDVGYPGRYGHSPSELVDIGDLELLSQWVLAALLRINQQMNFER